jgi:signal transduction histidine kinase
VGDDVTIDFRLLFEESPEVLLVLLPDAPRFTMVAATAARLRITLLTREETIGRGLFEVFPDNPDDPSATGATNLRASLDRVIATRAADSMAVQKYDIRRPDGSYEVRYWSPRNIPILSAQGELVYIFHRVEDVTDLVKAGEVGEELRDRTRRMEREVVARSLELADANQQLRDANARLGELDIAKTAFFSNISHEFRTPLTLMLGPAEDALEDHSEILGPRQRARVELIHANALRLLKLVGALLDFSRLEAGRVRAHFAPTDLAHATAELAGMFESAAERANLGLTIDCPPLSCLLWVDRDMWEKIVPNLVSNAIKFTHHGEIRVRLSEDATHAVLEVTDSGIGISESELARVFDRFHRVAGADGRTYEGSGIGLSLVRELVDLHGGDVSAHSEPACGTTFRVRIPKGFEHLPEGAVSREPIEAGVGVEARAHVAEAVRWSRASRKAGEDPTPKAFGTVGTNAGPRAHVLVVDDNADMREYLASLLSAPYEVTTAVDGEMALDAVRRRMPDLIVSDVMMPRLDGLGLVRALRATAETATLPVILLSARAGEDSSVEGIESGCDDYLVKPFSARELLARVRTHVELARTRRAWSDELERANRELSAFSYSVSHDLRSPLRVVDGFSLLLDQEYGAALDDNARMYIERIRHGVRHMTTLIRDLLELARVSRVETCWTRVDLSALARHIVDRLREGEPAREVTVEIAGGLMTQGDPPLLEVALTNLLGNAWKYTATSPQARIEVGRDDADGSPYFVRDNGVGFDMAHAEEIFRPFHRLHDAGEFEGSGVGLATVDRVIARHGGRIWAEGVEGHGATFFFTVVPPSSAAVTSAP